MFTMKEYITAAARTEKYAPTDWRINVPVAYYRGLHGILGLQSEIPELLLAIASSPRDHTNIVEEMGDMWWYAALLYRLCYGLGEARRAEPEIFASNGHPFARDAALQEITILSGLLGEGADLCKRTMYYGTHFPSEQLKDREIMVSLQRLTMFTGCDLEEVWLVNIAKLRARFPHEFTGEQAVDRDTQEELDRMVALRARILAARKAVAGEVIAVRRAASELATEQP